MKHIAFKFCLLCIGVLSFQQVFGARWHGIVPLQSSRADVVRTFHKCAESEKPCSFRVKHWNVDIEFSDKWPADFEPCPSALQPETIMLIELTPDRPVGLKESSVYNTGFESFWADGPDEGKYVGYIDRETA